MRECSARATLMARHCLLMNGKTAHSLGNKFNALMKQTMKKYLIFLASAALMLAVSCNKEEVATPQTSAETELITVELNPSTKTHLSGTATEWSAGDEVSVSVDGESLGNLTLVSGSTFRGQLSSASLADATEVTLHYPAGVTEVPATQVAVDGSFANKSALLDGTATLAALRAGEGAQLSNSTALLQFTPTIDGDVAFTIGTNTYTVTGCKADTEYYACVAAETGDLSYTVGIVLGAKEKAGFAPEANKVYPLGELTLKENAIYAVVGDYSNDGWNTDTMMYETTHDNLFVAHNIEFAAEGNFKIRKAGVWDDAYNFGSANTTTKTINSAVGVFTHGSSADITVNAATYDIYFDRLAGQVYIMEPGKSYTEATKQTIPATTYSLIGSFTGSGWSTDFNMAYSGDGIWTIVQNFKEGDAWKIRKTGDWNNTYTNVWVGYDNKSNDSGGNCVMKAAGDYVISYIEKNKNAETNIITLMKK